ncbi:MAG TPA: nitronate monooxygenase [Conexibacter sp.]|nr:nitronate monooxygenase [Conexibacter sp.]
MERRSEVPADAVARDVEAVRAATDAPFGVNVFAPPAAPGDADAVARYAATLGEEAERQGALLGDPRSDDDDWDAKLALLRAAKPAVASFTFGCPSPELVGELRAAGVAAWVTVTTPAEARTAVAAGADALVVQGAEAGGHRGGFDDAAPAAVGLLALLQLVAAEVDVPLVASGGIMTGAGIAAVLAAGARAAAPRAHPSLAARPRPDRAVARVRAGRRTDLAPLRPTAQTPATAAIPGAEGAASRHLWEFL